MVKLTYHRLSHINKDDDFVVFYSEIKDKAGFLLQH